MNGAAAVIGAAMDEHAADQQRLSDAIQRYGFEWEELGKKFQQTTLNNQAKDLIEDWRVLVGSGIEVATVNDRMASAMNGYLQSALAVGAEVPAAMQPILQSFADQGLLVDANGAAITDLSLAGVTFAETMSAGFDRVILKLDQLITSLIAAGTAIDPLGAGTVAGAQPAVGPTGYTVSEAARQAGVTLPFGVEIPHLASGGIVRRPTLAMIGEAGPEAVVPLDGSQGNGGGIVVQGDIHLHGVNDPEEFAEALMTVTRRNTKGSTSHLRRLVPAQGLT